MTESVLHGRRVPAPRSFVEVFEDQARRSPDRVAVVDGSWSRTYADVATASQRMAAELGRRGVAAGDHVVVEACASWRFVAAIVAVLRAGATYVPIEQSIPDARLRYIVGATAAKLLIGDDVARMGSLPIELAEFAELLNGVAAGADRAVAVPDTAIAYVIFTSGSTGTPKGVPISRASLANYLHWATDRYTASPAGAAPVLTSPAFDMAVTPLLCPLYAGGTVDLSWLGRNSWPADDEAFDFVKGTPQQIRLLTALVDRREVECRQVVFGGEALHRRDVHALSGSTVVTNEYGPTEATVGCCAFSCQAGDLPDGWVPIGRPIDNMSAYVVAPDDPGRLCAVGEAGELLVGGVGVAGGYLDNSAETARRFLTNPFDQTWTQLYRTGDLVTMGPDRQLRYLGRMDSQEKIAGYRVEPAEVVQALRDSPLIANAVVHGVDNDIGYRHLVAYVESARTSDPPSEKELQKLVADRLPAYMVPKRIHVVDRLPLSSNGKVDIEDLRRALS